MTPMQHTPSHAAMPKRRRHRALRGEGVTACRQSTTRERESSATTLPELNRTLLSTLWITRAQDAARPRIRAVSRPGRRWKTPTHRAASGSWVPRPARSGSSARGAQPVLVSRHRPQSGPVPRHRPQPVLSRGTGPNPVLSRGTGPHPVLSRGSGAQPVLSPGSGPQPALDAPGSPQGAGLEQAPSGGRRSGASRRDANRRSRSRAGQPGTLTPTMTPSSWDRWRRRMPRARTPRRDGGVAAGRSAVSGLARGSPRPSWWCWPPPGSPVTGSCTSRRVNAPVPPTLRLPTTAPGSPGFDKALGQWQHIGTRAEDPGATDDRGALPAAVRAQRQPRTSGRRPASPRPARWRCTARICRRRCNRVTAPRCCARATYRATAR